MTFNKLINLSGKVAVIVGGAGQIGKATATRLAELQATVVIITHRDTKQLEDFVKSLPCQDLDHIVIRASVTDSASLKDAASKVQQKFGRCDILVNSAGILTPIPPSNLHLLNDELFDNMLTTNLRGVYATIREFSDLMKSNGDALIINISSQSGQRASNSCVAYASGKAGMDLMTRTLAKSLAPTIRVIGIAPGYLENATSGVTRIESNAKLAAGIPLGRVASGNDIANAIEAFATHIRFATGITLVVDGGQLL
jgi:3-oxoacyl-[acyl-carrier protein] reductase